MSWLQIMSRFILMIEPPLNFKSPLFRQFYGCLLILYTSALVSIKVYLIQNAIGKEYAVVIKSVAIINAFFISFDNIFLTAILFFRGVNILQLRKDILSFRTFTRRDSKRSDVLFQGPIVLLAFLWVARFAAYMAYALPFDSTWNIIIKIIGYQLPLIRSEFNQVRITLALLEIRQLLCMVNRSKCRSFYISQRRFIIKALDCIDLFNKTLGEILALSILKHIIGILDNLLLLLSYYSDIRLKIVLGHFIATACAQILCLVVAGQKLSDEAKKCVIICTDLSQSVQKSVFTMELQQEAEKQFVVFAAQACQKCTMVNAAGMFPVDHSTVLLIFCNICTYLVVIFQLLPNQ